MIDTFGAENDVSDGRKVEIFSHCDMERKVGNSPAEVRGYQR